MRDGEETGGGFVGVLAEDPAAWEAGTAALPGADASRCREPSIDSGRLMVIMMSLALPRISRIAEKSSAEPCRSLGYIR